MMHPILLGICENYIIFLYPVIHKDQVKGICAMLSPSLSPSHQGRQEKAFKNQRSPAEVTPIPSRGQPHTSSYAGGR